MLPNLSRRYHVAITYGRLSDLRANIMTFIPSAGDPHPKYQYFLYESITIIPSVGDPNPKYQYVLYESITFYCVRSFCTGLSEKTLSETFHVTPN